MTQAKGEGVTTEPRAETPAEKPPSTRLILLDRIAQQLDQAEGVILVGITPLLSQHVYAESGEKSFKKWPMPGIKLWEQMVYAAADPNVRSAEELKLLHQSMFDAKALIAGIKITRHEVALPHNASSGITAAHHVFRIPDPLVITGTMDQPSLDPEVMAILEPITESLPRPYQDQIPLHGILRVQLFPSVAQAQESLAQTVRPNL